MFLNSGRLLSRNFRNSLFIADTVHVVNLCQHIKLGADRLNRCEDMAVFRFSKMAAVRHLGFVVRLLGPPTVVFIAVQNLFGIHVVVLKLCDFQCYAIVWLKNAYLRPFLGCFLIKVVENGNFLQFYPSRNVITWD